MHTVVDYVSDHMDLMSGIFTKPYNLKVMHLKIKLCLNNKVLVDLNNTTIKMLYSCVSHPIMKLI